MRGVIYLFLSLGGNFDDDLSAGRDEGRLIPYLAKVPLSNAAKAKQTKPPPLPLSFIMQRINRIQFRRFLCRI